MTALLASLVCLTLSSPCTDEARALHAREAAIRASDSSWRARAPQFAALRLAWGEWARRCGGTR